MSGMLVEDDQITISLPELMECLSRVTKGPEVYHSVKSAYEKLGVSKSTLGNWEKEGKMPKRVLVNGVERYRDSDLEKMIAYQNPHLLGVKENKVMADAMAVVANL